MKKKAATKRAPDLKRQRTETPGSVEELLAACLQELRWLNEAASLIFKEIEKLPDEEAFEDLAADVRSLLDAKAAQPSTGRGK